MSQLPTLADSPGTMREYETIYILRPDTPNSQLADINTKIKDIIESMSGKVLTVDNWGKKKLAYEVKKQLKGIYLYWQYLGGSELVAEIERNMRMMDSVIRYLTVHTKSNVVADTVDSSVNNETYEKAAITAADEEELVTGRAQPGGEHLYPDADSYLGSKESDGSDSESAEAAPANDKGDEKPVETTAEDSSGAKDDAAEPSDRN